MDGRTKEIAGVGSSSPLDMMSFQQSRRRTWQGRCLAIVRPTGEEGSLSLRASAEGLEKATLGMETRK